MTDQTQKYFRARLADWLISPPPSVTEVGARRKAQVATSIQNVRSFERSEKQADFEAMANTIIQEIQRSTTVEETLQTAIRELGTALGATRVKASIQGCFIRTRFRWLTGKEYQEFQNVRS